MLRSPRAGLHQVERHDIEPLLDAVEPVGQRLLNDVDPLHQHLSRLDHLLDDLIEQRARSVRAMSFERCESLKDPIELLVDRQVRGGSVVACHFARAPFIIGLAAPFVTGGAVVICHLKPERRIGKR